MARKKSRKSRTGARHHYALLKKKALGITLATACAVLLVAIIAFSSENLTGHATVQTVSYMQAGSDLFFEVDQYGIKYLDLHILRDVKNAKIVLEDLPRTSWQFRGVVLEKFKLSSADEEKFGTVTFTLKVKEEDIQKKGLKKGEVRLYQHGKELVTSLDKVEGDYVFYVVKTTGFGEFLIGKRVEQPVAEPVVGKAEEQPSAAEEAPEEMMVEPTAEPAAPTTVEPKLIEEGFFARIARFFKELFS